MDQNHVQNVMSRDAAHRIFLESVENSAEPFFFKRYNIPDGLILLFLYVSLALLIRYAGLKIDYF